VRAAHNMVATEIIVAVRIIAVSPNFYSCCKL
jgi:hypothetical protein